MKIAILGFNKIGYKVLDWLLTQGEEIVCVIKKKSQLNLLEKNKPDLILSVGFRSIISKEILNIPKYGCINFHKALLPMNRGANPVFWSVLENTQPGITIHYMTEGIDDGDIIAQQPINLYPQDTAKTLYERCEKEQLELFKQVWPYIRDGTVKPIPQKGTSSYHVKNDFKKIREITNRESIRYLQAMTFPGFKNAYFVEDGKKYFVEVKVIPEEEYNSGVEYLKQY